MRRLFEELRHRKVFRTAALYLVAAWVAVEVSSTIFPLLGVGGWAPRLVLALAAAGFPVALGLAWRFDLRDGRLRAASRDDIDPRHLRIGQAALVACGLLVGLAIPTFMVLNWGTAEDDPRTARGAPSDEVPGPSRTVAVLPFTGTAIDEPHFAEGVTDEIVLALARYDGLRVLSRAAAARLLQEGGEAHEVGRALGAGWILQGTIWRTSDELRVRGALTNAESYEVRWSNDYERELSVESLFDVQRAIAAAVAGELRDEIAPSEPTLLRAPPTADMAAFDHYLRGNAQLARRTPASVLGAAAEFRAAAERDPSFVGARAREAYALCLFLDWEWTYPGADDDELLHRALSLADDALGADSTSADAWLAYAYARLMANRDRPGQTLLLFERALTLNPGDAESYHQYGQTLMSAGRYAEALAAYHGALALDPTRAMTLVPMSAISYRRGDVGQARRWIDSAIVVGPEVPYAWAIRANLRNGTGDHAGARADAEMALAIDPSYGIPARSGLAVALHGLGDDAGAREELARAMEELPQVEAPGQTDAFFLAGALLSLGREDEAIDFLERATPRSAVLWFYLQHPDFDPVRHHPRIVAVELASDPNPGEPVPEPADTDAEER